MTWAHYEDFEDIFHADKSINNDEVVSSRLPLPHAVIPDQPAHSTSQPSIITHFPQTENIPSNISIVSTAPIPQSSPHRPNHLQCKPGPSQDQQTRRCKPSKLQKYRKDQLNRLDLKIKKLDELKEAVCENNKLQARIIEVQKNRNEIIEATQKERNVIMERANNARNAIETRRNDLLAEYIQHLKSRRRND